MLSEFYEHLACQEIIDMCDFAVGLSRQLNGSIIPSEREFEFFGYVIILLLYLMTMLISDSLKNL